MGMGMREIHSDVPGMGETHYEHIWNACVNKGPYLRYNWTFTDTDTLNQHPSKKIGKDFDNDSLFLRIERQVLQGFPEIQSVVFLIRTYVGNIKTLTNDQRVVLAKVVDEMSEDVLIYKNLLQYKNIIINRLTN